MEDHLGVCYRGEDSMAPIQVPSTEGEGLLRPAF